MKVEVVGAGCVAGGDERTGAGGGGLLVAFAPLVSFVSFGLFSRPRVLAVWGSFMNFPNAVRPCWRPGRAASVERAKWVVLTCFFFQLSSNRKTTRLTTSHIP